MPSSRKENECSFESPGKYLIRIHGDLGPEWQDRMGGMRITVSMGKGKSAVTTLVGRIRDQAELAGVLSTLYELHLTILSVEYLGVSETQ
jgi:hypothetical protein